MNPDSMEPSSNPSSLPDFSGSEAFALPQQYRSVIQAFEQQLVQLGAALEKGQGRSLLPRGQELQQQYLGQVQVLAAEALPREQRSRFQSIQTEMHRQVRLLQTDLMFLASARRAQTQAQRQQQLGDRLHSLQDFCRILLGK